MQKTQEAAAKAEAQRHAGLGLELEGGVVELELLQGIPEVRVPGGVRRVDAAVDHGLRLLVAGQGLVAGPVGGGDGIADPGIADLLDGSRHITDLAGGQFFAGDEAAGAEVADLHDLEHGARGHHLDPGPLLHGAVHHAAEYDDTAVGVIEGVENEGLERRLRIPLGRRQLLHDLLQHVVDVETGLGGDPGRVQGLDADDVLDLLGHLVGIGAGKVDLVDDRDDLQVMVHGQVDIAQGLGLHALGGVHHQDSAVAGGQGTGNFIIKVDVAGGIDQVENILLPVVGPIDGADGLGLDGDAPLPLQVHIVQDLLLHLPLGQKAGHLDDPVRQGGLAVVNVGDNTKVADLALVHLFSILPRRDILYFCRFLRPGRESGCVVI